MRFVDLTLAVAAVALSAAAPDEPAPESPGRSGGGSEYTAEQVRTTVEEHIRSAAAESGGVYRLRDDHAGRTLELELVHAGVVGSSAVWKVHDPDHQDERRAYFACIRFHPVGAPREKIYDVDMRVEPRDGSLAVTGVRIHKEKQLVNGKWIWEPRPARADARSR
jgi:hypothetical protein